LKKPTLLIVFLVVFIDLMGFGIVIPLLPLYGQRYHPSPAMFGLLMAVYSLMQFLFAPVLGRLSDRFGRRPILLLSLVGSVLGYLLFGLQNSLALLFLSRVVAGAMGANVSTAQAVIADVTPPEKRAHGMGLVGAAFGLGFILGPAIGGLAVHLGERWPGFLAAGLSFTALLVATIWLPETWTADSRAGRASLPRRGWFSTKALRDALNHPQIGLVLLIFFLSTFAFANFESTFALFLNHRLDLSVTHVTYLFVFIGVLAAVVQGGLIGRLTKAFGERRLVVAGTLILIPSYLLMLVASSVPLLMVFLIPLALGAGLVQPTLSSLVSRLSSADEQGGVLGLYQSMSSLARITGPFWGVYAFESIGMPAPYLTAAAVVAVSWLLALLMLKRAREAKRVEAQAQAAVAAEG
jgi:multidrug resistance protein